MNDDLVKVENRGPIAILTLDRPQSLNALSRALVDQLARHLDDAAADDSIRVVILAGSARAFCAGADITEVSSIRGAMPTDVLPFDGLFHSLEALAKPTIAAVQGLALGGGCELILACDITIAGQSARFGLPEVKLGVIPGGGGTQRLVRAIGKAKAMQMLLTGEPVDAVWALQAGLVADVIADDVVLDRALEIAGQIAGNAPRAVALAADAARNASELSLRQGLTHERRNFLLALGTSDAAEGIAAFAERRNPNFTGK